jgi:hypothetical protein
MLHAYADASIEDSISFIKALRQQAPCYLGLKEAKWVWDTAVRVNATAAMSLLLGLFLNAEVEIVARTVGDGETSAVRKVLFLKDGYVVWVENGELLLGTVDDILALPDSHRAIG